MNADQIMAALRMDGQVTIQVEGRDIILKAAEHVNKTGFSGVSYGVLNTLLHHVEENRRDDGLGRRVTVTVPKPDRPDVHDDATATIDSGVLTIRTPGYVSCYAPGSWVSFEEGSL